MAHPHCLSSQQPDVVQMPVPAAHAHASTIPACNSLKPFVTCRRLIPVSDTYKGDSFFTIENGKKIATPLLLVLAVVELSDVVFAVDSIPAVSAISALLLYSCAICLDGIALHCIPQSVTQCNSDKLMCACSHTFHTLLLQHR